MPGSPPSLNPVGLRFKNNIYRRNMVESPNAEIGLCYGGELLKWVWNWNNKISK